MLLGEEREYDKEMPKRLFQRLSGVQQFLLVSTVLLWSAILFILYKTAQL